MSEPQTFQNLVAPEHQGQISRGPCTNRLANKVALVTGAGGAQGQGQRAALLFAEAGATVYAIDINGEGLMETAALAREAGLTVHVATVDASNPTQVNAWVDDIAARQGRVDVLYNNGAGVFMAPFAELTVEQWHETIRLELDVIFMPTKAVWPLMVKQNGGSIINIASGSGMRATDGAGAVAHAAGKGGVISVTRQLAHEGAPNWIRVNSISPGPIMTQGIKAGINMFPHFSKLFSATPMLMRYGYPVDVAYAGLFLASDESRFITGANLPVDGGSVQKVGAVFGR
jgi:meso-butanediol dehydrogenase / (S,S)-butanediol dehydrogenase / diacetyl reductase